MSIDTAFERLRRANPEPDLGALRRQLSDGEIATSRSATRSDRMDLQTTPKTTSVPKARQRWVPAMAAFGLVLLAATALFILRGEGPPVLAEATPVEIAEEYMEARNAWDADRAAELLAPDAILNDMPMMTLDELGPGFQVLRAYGFQFDQVECVEFQAPRVSVRCTYMLNTRLTEIVGYRPVPGNFVFIVEDGRMTSLSHNFNFSEYAPNVFERFVDWLETERPGAFDQLFRWVGDTATPLLTPESIELIPGYLADFDDYVNGG
ncbi:MAG TPA: hypothetical protein VJR05_03860 [Acidimicrobiia bacterium]|nr:hypothetical protein [Acidimicrobiia bacterium]